MGIDDEETIVVGFVGTKTTEQLPASLLSEPSDKTILRVFELFVISLRNLIASV